MDNRDTEHFVLGIIVAVLAFFFFRRQIDRALGIGGNGRGASGNSSGKSGCCGGCSQTQPPPENPGVSVGGESYDFVPFGSASVHAVPHATFNGPTH